MNLASQTIRAKAETHVVVEGDLLSAERCLSWNPVHLFRIDHVENLDYSRDTLGILRRFVISSSKVYVRGYIVNLKTILTPTRREA